MVGNFFKSFKVMRKAEKAAMVLLKNYSYEIKKKDQMSTLNFITSNYHGYDFNEYDIATEYIRVVISSFDPEDIINKKIAEDFVLKAKGIYNNGHLTSTSLNSLCEAYHEKYIEDKKAIYDRIYGE